MVPRHTSELRMFSNSAYAPPPFPSLCPYATPNRFEVVTKEGKEQVVYISPHHKNDRRTPIAIEYTIPEGPLRDMLLLYISKGHEALVGGLCKGNVQPYMFMSGYGFHFNDATFGHWWTMVLDGKWLPGLGSFPKFCPRLGRNIYVEHVTSTTGYAPDEWEAPARAMGNSSRTWCAHYAVTLNARLTQRGVDFHQRLMAGGGPSGGAGGSSGGASASAAPTLQGAPTAGPSDAPIVASPAACNARGPQSPPPAVGGSGVHTPCEGVVPRATNELIDLTLDSSDDE